MDFVSSTRSDDMKILQLNNKNIKKRQKKSMDVYVINAELFLHLKDKMV